MTDEKTVAAHYTHGNPYEKILQAMRRSGSDLSKLTYADLAAVDEFHIGGIDATRDLASQLALSSRMRVLDVGCGIGGPARCICAEHSCHVTGVDLTPEFVKAATELTALVKLDANAEFRQANAAHLPFTAGNFDRAYMVHVGMNIPDKVAVFREVKRVLKPQGRFAIFDIMRAGETPLEFPVPWAPSTSISFVEAAECYRKALQASGFSIESERNRADFGIDFTERAMARVAETGPPALGLHLLMGEETPKLLKNVLAGMKSGAIAPVEMIAVAN